MGSTDASVARRAPTAWFWAALIVAVIGAAGSLALSLALNHKACPLCFYQRAFVLAAVAILVMQAIHSSSRSSLPALPLALAGLGVAAFHESLELRGRLECPAGLLGLGTAPQQSLALFALLSALLVGDAARGKRWAGLATAIALASLMAVGSIIANPPLPAAPTSKYPGPPEICRPPYRGA